MTESDQWNEQTKEVARAEAFEERIRILHLEDDPSDQAYVAEVLSEADLSCEFLYAEDRQSFERVLAEETADLIISDFAVPGYDGLSALKMTLGLDRPIPFILFSGTIGEEAAIESLRLGATDYVLKQRPDRLVTAVRRALQEAGERKARHRVEAELRRRETLLRQILESIEDMIMVIDADGHRVLSSPSCVKIEGQGSRMTGAREERPLVLWVSRDITDRQHAENQIREQAALIDKAREAIFVNDLDQNIQFWSRGAERLYGWTAEEAVGRNANDLLFHKEIALTAVKTLIKEGQWYGELQQTARSGQSLVVESRWSLIRDESGAAKAILVINSDITEKKQIELQFLRTQRMENIGALAGGIAHDLNNILSPIRMAAELVMQAPLDPALLEMLETIQTCAARGAHLVKQILSFARGVQGEKASVAIGQMVSELASFIRNTFPPDIVLETNVEHDLPPVLADATQLHQILLNLSVNARDAMPSGGNLRMNAALVELTARQSPMLAQPVSGWFIELTVSDSGSGIAPEILPKIFEPFFTTKETEKGTGLGLSTVVSIVKAHGGFIEVESEPGKGTTFRIYLPAGKRTAAVEEKSAAKAEQGGGEQLLVVDDENAILELSRTILTEFNYRVLSASDGVQALSLFIEHQATIDLVITDLMMPSMGGADLISAIRKIRPDVRVLAVSGLGEGRTNAESGGEDGFLSKPYTGATLLASVHAVLARSREAA